MLLLFCIYLVPVVFFSQHSYATMSLSSGLRFSNPLIQVSIFLLVLRVISVNVQHCQVVGRSGCRGHICIYSSLQVSLKRKRMIQGYNKSLDLLLLWHAGVSLVLKSGTITTGGVGDLDKLLLMSGSVDCEGHLTGEGEAVSYRPWLARMT